MAGVYRKNVGIAVFNKDQKVLMCARADKPGFAWQFPQGGIDNGETPLEAAYRELKEETGITSVEFVAQLNKPLRYDFPTEILENFKKLGRNNIGQEQYWVLFYFYGEDSEIDFATHPEEIEFKAYEWVDISEAPQRIVPFKKDVYQKVAKAFQPYIRKKNGKNWSLSKEMILQHKMEDIRIYSRYRER